ncbi:HNH endonuclease [Flaviaesturariibacter flavus]|uniref:HNH endonuclease n=1 Tax=Flaviaesturariibacter flavus TaxID=2502780 RepID=A0A4R1BIH3_9BACT|nr:HNH endonuclease signature motif containing protein [Flaviaesturariibacter flavus]TCJ17044.1 HNH endonuclease [Flaviaesturariibacter flavus]
MKESFTMAPRICVVCATPISGQKVKYCSNACKQKDHYHRVKQQTTTYHSQTIRSLRRKLQLVEMFGGKCDACGYDKNLAALHFHHIDANNKAFKLDVRFLSNRTWEAIISEAQKCRLLCSNCHSELHHPELALDKVQRMISGAAGTKLPDGIGVNSGKPSFLQTQKDGNPEPSRTNG